MQRLIFAGLPQEDLMVFMNTNYRHGTALQVFLVVEEAGGKVTDLNGKYYNPYQPGIVATNGKIHEELIAVINNEIQL